MVRTKQTDAHHRQAHGRHIHARRMEDIQKAVLAGEDVESPGSKSREERNIHSHETGGTLLIISCFLGIFISYFVYGLLQEKM